MSKRVVCGTSILAAWMSLAICGAWAQAPGGPSLKESVNKEGGAHSFTDEPVKWEEPAWAEAQELRGQVSALFEKKDFAALDRLAAELRASKARLSNGKWKIETFYGPLSLSKKLPDDAWATREEVLQEWETAAPKSAAAQIAHALFLVDYAWKARGNGYANTVTDDMYKLFAERLKKAREILLAARSLEEKDPMLYRTALSVALGEGWPPASWDRVMADGLKLAPEFFSLDEARAYALLPRWYGKEGDWETYAEQAAARPEGLGAETYARIVLNLKGFHGNIFQESKASWPKTKEGLRLMAQRYPDAVEHLSNGVKLANQAKDREFARELFQQIGNRFMPTLWQGKPEVFKAWREWTVTGNYKDPTKAKKAPKPPASTTPESTENKAAETTETKSTE